MNTPIKLTTKTSAHKVRDKCKIERNYFGWLPLLVVRKAVKLQYNIINW